MFRKLSGEVAEMQELSRGHSGPHQGSKSYICCFKGRERTYWDRRCAERGGNESAGGALKSLQLKSLCDGRCR